MGKVEDYITGLEGKENIDPVVIARTLLELHNEEIGNANAQIASLNETIGTHETTIAEKDSALQKQMAANWQLANRIPVENGSDPKTKDSSEDKDASEIAFTDFLKEED